ncbi:MAG: hypothetical protein Fur002_08190 [Anaerolineales bacterium]
MKKISALSNFAEKLFDLSSAGMQFRTRWRSIAFILAWLALSAFATLLTVFTAQGQTHRAVVIGMNFIKYAPMLVVAYNLARKKAAQYLTDIYEIEDPLVAENFIEHAAFAPPALSRSSLVVIEDGEIQDKDEDAPLLRIGGPGYLQVNLDSAALIEKVNGEPKALTPASKIWQIRSFERIREIGVSEKTGERQYAIINLREQHVKDITIKARTKDGVPVEVHDFKVKFRILGHMQEVGADDDLRFICEEGALQALIYQQTTITPPRKIFAGADFPWNSTIIPLIISEVEKIISAHTADEIAVGIGEKEMKANADIAATASQTRIEATGALNSADVAKKKLEHAHESREKIKNHFYEKAFKEKAAALGVRVTFVDIGTWQPAESIKVKIRSAWEQSSKNRARLKQINNKRNARETEETLKLIDSVINPLHERIHARSDPKQKEKQQIAKELQEMAAKNPNLVVNPAMLEPFLEDTKKSTAIIARDMLKAFRKELLAGKAQLTEKLAKADEARRAEFAADIQKIEAALHHINQYFPR